MEKHVNGMCFFQAVQDKAVIGVGSSGMHRSFFDSKVPLEVLKSEMLKLELQLMIIFIID